MVRRRDRFGISVKDAIAIARYSSGWRGINPKFAGEHGAMCIIYSDPKDDGYCNGEDYPSGPWRPRFGVQRGGVIDTDYPGDPLTPGVGATAEAKRLPIKDAKTIAKIPLLPISYPDALPLLSALRGPRGGSMRGTRLYSIHHYRGQRRGQNEAQGDTRAHLWRSVPTEILP
jgi:N-acetylated-alpha-linked acidic dipeptidase